MTVAFCFRTDVVCSWNQESCCLLMLILLMLVAVQSGGWALGKDDGWLGHDLKLRMLPACVLFLVHGLCLRCFTRSMLHAEAFFCSPLGCGDSGDWFRLCVPKHQTQVTSCKDVELLAATSCTLRVQKKRTRPVRITLGVAVWKGLHVSLEILENASVRKLQEKEHFDRVITGDTANHEQVFRNSPVFISGTSSSDTFDTRHLLHQTTFSLNTVYNRHLLHQTPCRPDTFYTRHIFTRHLLHPTPLTPNTFYTKHLLYQTPFKPGTFYTRHLLHPTPFTPDNFFTKHILQQAPCTPKTLYTRHLLYQAHLHQTPFTPCVNHPPPPHPLLILTSFARWNYA